MVSWSGPWGWQSERSVAARCVIRVRCACALALLHGGDARVASERRGAERRRKTFVHALYHGDGGGRSRFAAVRGARRRSGGAVAARYSSVRAAVALLCARARPLCSRGGGVQVPRVL